MKRLWDRETLRFVDGWACREGTPEGDEDDRTIGGESAGAIVMANRDANTSEKHGTV